MVAIKERVRNTDIITIPRSLVYEEFDGYVFPYKGFRDVLNKKTDLEAIVGSSSIQAFICGIIYGFIFNNLSNKHIATTDESGLHLSKNNNLTNDIAIFDASKVTLDNKYFSVAPEIAIEVDIRADLSDEDSISETDYIFRKSKKMIEFGTQKVIWVLTDSRKIIIVDASPEWKIVDFDADVPVMEGVVLNLKQLMAAKGVEF